MSVFRIGIALTIFCAIGAQLAAQIDAGASIANLFGFFTMIANGIAACVFVYAAFSRPPSPGRDRLRGAAVLYLVIVGTVYATLLTGVQSGVIPWVNVIVHVVSPIAAAVDWVVDPPASRLDRMTGLTWLVLPVAYLFFTFVRGAIAGWYPYPFLDARLVGTPAVVAYCVAIFVFAALADQVVIAAGNSLRARRTSAAETVPQG
ncbi:MAG: Pr6Pr family membrane protein [Candidatus Eremiobacteraeota bacterium]|nr:Pr6Pr family membrane protein [Candidatus Eremiobacteraeota bacterium]